MEAEAVARCVHDVPIADYCQCYRCEDLYRQASRRTARRMEREQPARYQRQQQQTLPTGPLNPRRLRMARELRGITRSSIARIIGMPYLRYRALEDGAWKARPTEEQIRDIALITGMLPAFFWQDDPPTFDLEQSSLRFHQYARICDVCARETGDEDTLARTKCAACKLDLCEAHAQGYEIEVDLPHGGTKRVAIVEYCETCYRRFVTEPKRQATRQVNLTARAQKGT